MKKSKICILFCGWTIVMNETSDWIHELQEDKVAIKQLMNLEPKIKNIADIDVLFLENIESCDMKTTHWDLMAKTIKENYDKYDWFVITHWTDTMAYTSSALSFSLWNIWKPVILTGAQIPANQIETDWRRNFINSIRVATQDISWVYIVFDERIVEWARASKISESDLDAYRTINKEDIWSIWIKLNIKKIPKRHSEKLILQNWFESDILSVNIWPWNDPNDLKKLIKSNDIKWLVLNVYWVWNIPSWYLDVLSIAKQNKVPVLIATQCFEWSTLMHDFFYWREMLKNWAIQAFDMSNETASVKFMWAIKNNKYENIKKIMYKKITNEITVLDEK